MSGDLCPTCRKARMVSRKEKVRVTLDDGSSVILAAAPHELCPKCGERIYSRRAAQTITRSRKRRAA